jgi:hypothetical protein
LDRLSGLPLALTQAAAYISQTGVTLVQYLEYYDNMWRDLMEQQDQYPLQEYAQRSVLTTWRLSYEHVKSQNEGASCYNSGVFSTLAIFGTSLSLVLTSLEKKPFCRTG